MALVSCFLSHILINRIQEYMVALEDKTLDIGFPF